MSQGEFVAPGSPWLLVALLFLRFQEATPRFFSMGLSICILALVLRTAKARFSLLVITLAMMLGHVWTGILLACWHPLFSLSLLISLITCCAACRALLSLFLCHRQSACGSVEHTRHRRLPRDLRKQCKRAAKQQRSRIFNLGSRFLLFLQVGQRCLELIC